MKKLIVLMAFTTLFYSCDDDLEETLPDIVNEKEDLTASKTLNLEKLILISGYRGPFGWVRSGDFNGDGKEDLIELDQKGAQMLLSGDLFSLLPIRFSITQTDGRYGGSAYTFTGDFNGDGFADIASANGRTVYMKLNKGLNDVGNRFERFEYADWNVANSWGGGAYTFVGDFNGDGQDDIASASGSAVFMKISTGHRFVSHTWSTDGRYGGGGYTFVGDYNGDGKDDIISASYGTLFIKESTGSGFVSKIHITTNQWGGSGYTWMADTDGDGKDEIITAMGSTVLKREWISGDQWSLESFTTGQYWDDSGRNFAMDITGSGSDEIVSHLVTPDGFSLYIH